MTEGEAREAIGLLTEIRNWLRAGFHNDVQEILVAVLDSDKKRAAYQMADGSNSIDHIRTTVGMSPNAVVALFAICTDLGLMEVAADKRRTRLFDLRQFGMAPTEESLTSTVPQTRRGGAPAAR